MIDFEAVEKAQNDRSFGETGWLTFYLQGSADQHMRMAPGLQELGAINLSDGSSGFVYAKVPVAIERSDIEARIEQVRALAKAVEIEIAVIDLDASSNVEKSKFYTLWLAK